MCSCGKDILVEVEEGDPAKYTYYGRLSRDYKYHMIGVQVADDTASSDSTKLTTPKHYLNKHQLHYNNNYQSKRRRSTQVFKKSEFIKWKDRS
ncbi:hypothetical protein Y032_0244g3532 [Ancylostoma ceylanicum]|uniref:Uncharacterized protein n=1 Tax=Ancylostoma ceylanicum TaxID=53326 RepID=A0A016SE14_9BILA|nr:hypothetical protein Y032_0244g3532 [Ancylostoma ceylanicum]